MIPSQTFSVEQFFQQANWQGLKLVSLPEESPSDTQVQVVEDVFTPRFNLTVQDFFASHNWQGIVKTKTVRVDTSDDLIPTSVEPHYSLTLSVEQFFHKMPWSGQLTYKKASIASLPQVSPSNTFASAVKPLNVNDLSDLL
ncbi:hypothetical protein ACN4EE_19440 [Geminocystis sp. CENA526]|uniref:hypothetical protein n=1 Tax=Geminocystis sp. CENA526 TaxID=1355871 RepID=UPI003D6E5BC8